MNRKIIEVKINKSVIFMLVIFLTLILLISSYDKSTGNEIPCEDKQIETIIKRLNEENNNIRQDMRLLTTKPYQSAGCLVKELDFVRETKILHKDFVNHKQALHVVWCIRTLRYLTGIDFKGHTSHKFTKAESNRKYLLTKEGKEKLSFFAVWMSRDTIYFAPNDTQKEIIEKWKMWYFDEAKSFDYKPLEDVNEWYF